MTDRTDVKQIELDKVIKKESARKFIEKYSYKEIRSRWLVIPMLSFLCGCVYLFIQYKDKQDVDQTFLSFFFVSLVVFLVATSCKEKWDIRLKAKRNIFEKDSSYKFNVYGYQDGYIYTDQAFEKFIYQLSKVICYIIGLIFVGLASILLFSWLGTISIAPTTIIIVLLIVIIVNQEKRV